MINKILAPLILIFCLLVSLLRGLGIMEGDFIIPLILLSQLFILGYLVQFLQMFAKDVVVRYTRQRNDPMPPLHTWN